MLKVAFIGAGRMANAHAAQLQKIENVEIAGVYDIDPEKSRIFAERYRIPKQYASQEELLGDRSLNGILMCHYCPDHAASMMAAMQAGFRYIFSEKPAIRRMEEGPALLKAAERHGAKIMIGHHRKHDEINKKMREIIPERRARDNPFCESSVLQYMVLARMGRLFCGLCALRRDYA